MSRLAVHLAWTRFQRRQISMAPSLGLKVRFFPASFRGRALKPLEYASKALQTIAFCLTNRPDEIWVQLPPLPLLCVVLVYRWLRGGRVRVVADCHNSMLRPPWSQWPGASAVLNRCDLVLVHNEAMVDAARAMGVRRELIQVLEDAPAMLVPQKKMASNLPSQWVLFPASFSADEPIAELLLAAEMAKEITFVITGNVNRARGRFDLSTLPPNVQLTGYLPVEEFDCLLLAADAVLALTRYEGIQLSVCNEAIGATKPMILSDTVILRKLFGEVAVMVDSSSPESIAQGCREALSSADILTRKTLAFRGERWRLWESSQAQLVRNRLEDRCANPA